MKGEEYNYKADLWNIGIIIYRLYFGKFLFPVEKQVLFKKKFNKLISKTKNNELDDLIKRLLEKDTSKISNGTNI